MCHRMTEACGVSDNVVHVTTDDRVFVTSLQQLKNLLDQNPVVKWVITPDGALRVVPKRAGGAEISHAVAAENQAVKAAGEARLRNGTLEINRWSGHYQGQTWFPGQRAFENMGLPVKLMPDQPF